ncbi:OsmC family protein [Sphingomonas sp. 7/4-4]|jgi:osmotically inducible protein OsmC|uniref:OsmC family protein n=1 Tax=Sphingomonas sp. 7/4-4 TaxID=3018446 RepID=UPI0022F3BB63|nr:OsmC family protein [Sphingomonas sp. 7/4-4]WBY07591.1 OsmC family protein [Sphingomonas sp. 7/4-4]
MTTRTATARYQGFGKDGKGQLDTPSGVLDATPYSYNTRFGDEKGTNPEELIAAAHAGCFTMALSFALARAGFSEGSLETTAAVKLEQQGDSFAVTRSDLTLKAEVPGISPEQFDELAAGAKANCPISKLLKAEITLSHTLA